MDEQKSPELSELQSNKASAVSRQAQHQRFERSKRKQFRKKNQPEYNIPEMAEQLISGNRVILSKAITLIESYSQYHYEKAQDLLNLLLPHTGASIRVGITGVPGAGKSTFIEAFGLQLCEQGYKVAVLAVDPSSTITGGSILGDKTRMEKLAKHPNAFIRPSPSSGTLGGVHRKTRETMLACEAAGYEVILIETVGVGQSEVMVRGMVDFFMLLALTGAGDELQGMKKGIIELADAIMINKADGENKALAEKTCREFNQILHFLLPSTRGWKTKAYTCSALRQEGLKNVWRTIQDFQKKGMQTGAFPERRLFQEKEWLYSMIKERLETSFFENPAVKKLLPEFQSLVTKGDMTVSTAVDSLFKAVSQKNNEDL